MKTLSVMNTGGLLLLLAAAGGCRHVGSSLHLDSNSRVPFLGLQWAVDRTEPQDSGAATTAALVPPVAGGTAGIQPAVLREAMRSDRTNFIPTAKSRSHSGNLKYSLPARDLSTDPEAAAEVQDLINRLHK
ncbi:MAG: hypothetical protein KDA89_13875 [Planctomycetaceae bacterium]|nr:hypothetical protein [Planctomycetaceae bacterium]